MRLSKMINSSILSLNFTGIGFCPHILFIDFTLTPKSVLIEDWDVLFFLLNKLMKSLNHFF